MNTWEEDYWHGGNPQEHANFALMTHEEDEQGPPPRSAWWLVFWLMVSCSMWAGIGWAVGRLW